MRITRVAALFFALSVQGTAALAEHPHEPTHAPLGGAADDHGHAHGHFDLAHPIITESPVPHTLLRFDYRFSDVGDGTEHTAFASLEYGFTENAGVEVIAPYTFLDPDEGGTAGRFGDVEVAIKVATYRFTEYGLVPAAGLAVTLPTGNEERGVGSDHVFEVEPFVRVGYRLRRLELIGSLNLGVPFNQDEDAGEDEDFGLAYNLSALYHVAPRVQGLVELHGDSAFGGDDSQAFYVSPGVTFQPFTDRSVNFGIGVTLPLTDDRDSDYTANFMTIFHF